MLNNEALFKRHFTGEEEAWLFKFGTTVVVADRLTYTRPSRWFVGHLCVTISPSPFGRGRVPANPCLAEKDVPINGRETNHSFME